MEVLFPEYFQSISRIFPYHGQHFHTMELDIPTFFYKISKIFIMEEVQRRYVNLRDNQWIDMRVFPSFLE